MRKWMFKAIIFNIAITTSAFAAHSTPASTFSFPITIPSMAGGFEFNIQGIYAQPTADSYTKSIDLEQPTSTTTTNTTLQTVNMDYNWGFTIGGGYIFNQTGNDIQLNWNHLSNTTTNISNINGTTPSTTLLNIINLSTFTIATGQSAQVNASVSISQDAADLDIGQYVNIGSALFTRWFVGLRYAKLHARDLLLLSGTQTNNLTIEAFSQTSNMQGTFNGIGPRIGVELNYMVWNAIGIIAEASGFFLPGTMRISSDVILTETKNNPAVVNESSHQNKVVPGYDAKLGLNYAKILNNNTLNTINFEAGYQTTNYVNALIDPFPYMALSNLAFAGPYAGMSLRFS